MYICPVCNHTSETPTNFCSKCGSTMVEKAPEAPVYTAPEAPAYTAPEAPVYTAPQQPTYTAPQQPTYTAPQQPAYTAPQGVSYTYQAPVEENKVPLGKVIAGMAIAIVGLLFSLITFINSMDLLDYGAEAFGYALGLGGFFAFPLSMVGFTLSKGAVNDGSDSGMAKAGKIVGLIGFILAAVTLGITFIALLADM